MAEPLDKVLERYLVVVRIASPGRLQDFKTQYLSIWDVPHTETLDRTIEAAHFELLKSGQLVQVRRGTYVLNKESFEIAGRYLSERTIDNARLFLMKRQRRAYHRDARRLGLVAASAYQPIESNS